MHKYSIKINKYTAKANALTKTERKSKEAAFYGAEWNGMEQEGAKCINKPAEWEVTIR